MKIALIFHENKFVATLIADNEEVMKTLISEVLSLYLFQKEENIEIRYQ